MKLHGLTFLSSKMSDNDTRRLYRLTVILLHLQTKRFLTTTSLSEKFKVSIREQSAEILEH